jgi:hypothetical protein
MNKVISECKRVLKNEGQAIFVIGNSSIYGVHIKNSEALIELANRNSFTLLAMSNHRLPENRRYLPPPNSKSAGKELGNRIREEVILQFILSK